MDVYRNRPHSQGRRPARGFTLIEVIIVMAIIALLGAITVPTLARMGLFSRDDINDAARDLYGLMRAARMYATTHRVDTAVVYVLNAEPDSRNAVFDTDYAPQIVGDALAMARRLKPEEEAFFEDQLVALDAQLVAEGFDPIDRSRFYVLVDTIEGRMVPLSGDARIRAAITDVALWVPDPDDPESYPAPTDSQLLAGDNRAGLFFLMMGRNDEGVLTLVEPRRAALQGLIDEGWGQLALHFPAHVFRPSGELRTGGTPSRPRLEVTIGPSPALEVRQRFTDYDIDSADVPILEVPPARVVVNQFSGRVVVERE